MAESDALADIIGAVAHGPAHPDGQGTAIWLVSDTSSESFNKEVPTAVTGNPQSFIFRDYDGIFRNEHEWMLCEFVEPDHRA